MAGQIRLGTWIAAVGAVSHLSELPDECNFYKNHADLRHQFKGPPRGMKALYYMETTQDEVTAQESILLYSSKFWAVMNETDGDGNIIGKQRLFLEAGTSLQFVLAHNNEAAARLGAPNDLQQYNRWGLIVDKAVHWYPPVFGGAKAAMFAFGCRSALRLDGTTATWKDGIFGNPDDPEWQAHRVLHVKPIPGDYQTFLGANATNTNFRITIAHTVPVIEFKVREPQPLGVPAPRIDVVRVFTTIVTQLPKQLKTCRVCLRSQGENRADEPLWERRGEFVFEPFTDEHGVPYSAARVTFNNVPTGWGEMMIEAEGYRKMTMKVFVTPELWFEQRGGRFYLRESPIKPVTGAPAPVFKQVQPPGVRIEPALQHMPGMLWKRVDGYFEVDEGGSRYDPTTIKLHKYEQNGQWFQVDAHKIIQPCDDPDCIYCGPNDEVPPNEVVKDPEFCRKARPQHESEPIGEIILEQRLARVRGPAQASITEDDGGDMPEDDLCED